MFESNGYTDRIVFENNIMVNMVQKEGEKWLCYTFKSWKQSELFDIINYISEYVTLVQFVETVGNVSCDVIIAWVWIFDSNYKKSLSLLK